MREITGAVEQEVKAMIIDQSTSGIDSRLLEDISINDLDTETLKQYRQRFININPDHPWEKLDNQQFLEKLGGWKKDRKSNKEGATVAGLLMFGKDHLIREVIPQFNLDYREILSEDEEVRWTDRVTMNGTWEGNLYQFYFKVIGKLREGLKVPFKMEGLIRKEDTHIHQALREAFINAMIHADYNLPTGIVIIKQKNLYMFSNPGTLKIPAEIALSGGVSAPRNPSLQLMFQMIGLGERSGSGIPKILRAWEEQHWRMPELKEELQPDRTVLKLWTVSLIPEECLEDLEQMWGARFNKLGKTEVLALITAYLEGKVTNSRLQAIAEEHPSDLTKMLQSLVEKDFLKTNNSHGRGMVYFLNSVHNKGDSVHNETNSVHKKTSSVHKDENLKNRLLNIAEPARKNKRISPEDMKKIIIQLCSETELKLDELAELLDRSTETLRTHYVSQMVKDDELQMLYPDEPNHPKQAYLRKQN